MTINHLGDWGHSSGFVWAGKKIWPELEDQTIDELVALYKKATGLKEEQSENSKSLTPEEDVNQIARDYFIRLEAADSEAQQFWQHCLDVSLTYLKEIYRELDIEFDYFLGESFFAKKLDETLDYLKENSLLKDSDGAQGVDLGEDLGFVRMTTEGRTLAVYGPGCCSCAIPQARI